MHWKTVHKEKIKEKPTDSTSKEEPDETRKKAIVRCEICGKTFSHMDSMKKHIT